MSPASNGKYEVVFRSSSGKKPSVGDVRKVKAGDVVTYYDNGFRTSEVERVIGKFARKVKVKPVMYGENVVRRGRLLELGDIKEVLRPLPASSTESASQADTV